MTYNQKLKKLVLELDSDGEDINEVEWAVRILASIGITPDNPDGGMNAGLPEAVRPTVMIPPVNEGVNTSPPILKKPHPNIPMPCCERPETRTKECFTPIEQPPDFKSKGW